MLSPSLCSAEFCIWAIQQFLMTHFHLRMLPVITATWESISDEETLIALFCTVKNIVQDGEAIKAGEFARNLISKHWVSMAFESMSKFPSEDLKQNVYSAIGTMINKISSSGELIQDDVLHHLPVDVEGLLMLYFTFNFYFSTGFYYLRT